MGLYVSMFFKPVNAPCRHDSLEVSAVLGHVHAASSLRPCLLRGGMCDAAAGNGAKGGSGGGFNPFGLPSPSFASPVPVTADNRFADVSPMADAPPPSVPAPMRVRPSETSSHIFNSDI